MAKKPCSDFHADWSKTAAARAHGARGALFLSGVSERSEARDKIFAGWQRSLVAIFTPIGAKLWLLRPAARFFCAA